MAGSVEMTAHSGQVEVLKSDARFKILACGRRWGKTTTAIFEVVDELSKPGQPLVWWVAPVYTQAEIGLRKFLETFPRESIENVHRSKREVTTTWGARIQFKNAQNPDHLRGEGVDLLVLDEAPEFSKYAWQNALAPTLADSEESEMIAIGTPKGKNWFHSLFKRGEDPQEDDYAAWQRPTTENQFISQDYVEEMERTMPERVFNQEFLAKFVDDSGGVFDKPRDRIVEDYDWREYGGEAPYTTGVDFARHSDWTVILSLDANRKLVHFDRLQKVTWDEIYGRVVDAYERYPGPVRVDASRDNKIVEDLHDAGVQVEPVAFTSSSKKQMMENLAALNERRQMTIPDDLTQLVNELEIFEYDVTRSGNVRYHAPEGQHDDCVDALALATMKNRTRTSSDTLIMKS